MNQLYEIKKLKMIVDAEPVSISNDELTALNDRQQIVVRRNRKAVNAYRITYISGKLKIKGYIVVPKKLPDSPMPCIIANRGGTGEFGKWTTPFVLMRLAKFASWGYIVIASQYRGNDGSDGTEEFGGGDVDDILALKKILDVLQFADSKRVGMWGGSRGGMMTYMTASRAKWLKAAVTVAGLADAKRSFLTRKDISESNHPVVGYSESALKEISALHWPHKFSKKIPFLILHGTADWRVDPRDSLELSMKLFEAKVPHRLIMYEGADHTLTENFKEAYEQIRNWFDRFVRDGEDPPNLKPHGA